MSSIQQNIRETKTEYDRHDRQWLAYPAELELEQAFLAGAVEIFPAGSEGKRAAILSALTHDAPGLAAWVDALIQARPTETAYIDRLLRAGLLVRDGHVHPDGAGYMVTSQSQSEPGRAYRVEQRQLSGWHCECEDWENGRAVKFGLVRDTWAPHVPGLGIACKHVLACYLAGKVQADQAYPISDGDYCQPYEDIYR